MTVGYIAEIKVSQDLSSDSLEKTNKTVQDLSQTTAMSTLSLQKIADYNKNKVESETVQECCQNLKSEMALRWSSRLNTRKKHYWNFVKNKAKAELYSNWQTSTPNFIPLKYRPKRISGETPEFTTRRLSEAKLRYKNDTEQMMIYAQTHHARATEVDEKMFSEIQETCSDPAVQEKLLQDWHADTYKEESVSNQVWLRHEQFLRRKKREDEEKMCTLLTTHTWEEQLLERRGKRQKPRHQTSVKNCTTFVAPLP